MILTTCFLLGVCFKWVELIWKDTTCAWDIFVHGVRHLALEMK